MKKEDVKPMTPEEMHSLFMDMMKIISDTPNDTKMGRKIRKTVIEFGKKKYNIKQK